MSTLDFESLHEQASSQPVHTLLHKPNLLPHFAVSPSLCSPGDTPLPAYEIKFVLPEEQAGQLESHIATLLHADPHSHSGIEAGGYLTTTVYCDTPAFDTYFRRGTLARRKFRLRRYGRDELVFLERKSKHGLRVKKHRSQISLSDVSRIGANLIEAEWNGEWFRKQIAGQCLSPVLAVRYSRTAFVGCHEEHPIRVTFDRDIAGLRTDQWTVEPFVGGDAILTGLAICEFKFRGSMPGLFKSVIEKCRLSVASASKYRLCLDAAGGPVQKVREDV